VDSITKVGTVFLSVETRRAQCSLMADRAPHHHQESCMKLCLTAVAATLVALAAPATASAASLNIEPEKRCYRSGERVSLMGTDFSPRSKVRVTRDDGMSFKPLDTNSEGAFEGTLTLGQSRNQRTSTYTARDRSRPGLTASDQIRVSAVDVRIKPESGAANRRVMIDAEGFTTGTVLYVHIVRGRSRRTIRLGELKRACRKLEVRRRLLRRGAAPGVYSLQFDTFPRYKRYRAVSVPFTITVQRASRSTRAVASWSRLP
jgi:hypothetical protein